MARYDYLIVGSGFYGTVVAERLKNAGKSVLVIEKRDHVGGNSYSYTYEGTDISVHKYGTHIFHTSNKAVWDYITRFGEFNRYQHRVLTTYKNKVYTMPINLGTINSFFGLNLRPFEVDKYMAEQKGDPNKVGNLEEKAINLIGKELYEAFVKGYTQKQWGCDPKLLPADIITRLPIRNSYNDSYFNDTYQGIPIDGYTSLFERMLEGVPLELNVDFFSDRSYWMGRCRNLVYTGPVDQYFDYEFGRLSWRSVQFEVEHLPYEDYQGTSVMNYADTGIPYTRIHEPKHLHPEKRYGGASTVVIREYSLVNDNEPYYPVNCVADRGIYARYQERKTREAGVFFGGRLAEYKYYDMHHVIEKALNDTISILLAG